MLVVTFVDWNHEEFRGCAGQVDRSGALTIRRQSGDLVVVFAPGVWREARRVTDPRQLMPGDRVSWFQLRDNGNNTTETGTLQDRTSPSDGSPPWCTIKGDTGAIWTGVPEHRLRKLT